MTFPTETSTGKRNGSNPFLPKSPFAMINGHIIVCMRVQTGRHMVLILFPRPLMQGVKLILLCATYEGLQGNSVSTTKDGSWNRGLSAQESWGKNYTKEEHVLRMVYELYTLLNFQKIPIFSQD